MAKRRKSAKIAQPQPADDVGLVSGISELLGQHAASRGKVGIAVADPNGVVFHSPGQRPGFAVARQLVHPKGVTPSGAARRSTARVAPRWGLGLVDATFPRAAPWALESCPGGADRQDPPCGYLAVDLTARHRHGFSVQALFKMRGFYLGWQIFQTPSGNSSLPPIAQTPSAELMTNVLQLGSLAKPGTGKRQTPSTESAASAFVATIPLSWSREGGEVE